MSGVFSRNAFELFRQQLERRDKKRLDWGKSFSERREMGKDGDRGDLIFPRGKEECRGGRTDEVRGMGRKRKRRRSEEPGLGRCLCIDWGGLFTPGLFGSPRLSDFTIMIMIITQYHSLLSLQCIVIRWLECGWNVHLHLHLYISISISHLSYNLSIPCATPLPLHMAPSVLYYHISHCHGNAGRIGYHSPIGSRLHALFV